MKNNILASEAFSSNKKHYFLDFKHAENNTNFIQITRSDLLADNTYKRSHVIVFEEDFHFLIQAFASLFQSASYLQSSAKNIKHSAQMRQDEKVNGIKGWEAELRPREKMLSNGADQMDNSELLAILIGSGTPNETAVSLAHRILESLDGNLEQLSIMDAEMLSRFKGMGIAKSCSIMAAMELARRMQ